MGACSIRNRQRILALMLCSLSGLVGAAELVTGQVAPLSGVLASTGHHHDFRQ